MRDADHRTADRIEGTQRAELDATAHRRAEPGADRFAAEDEDADAEHGDQRAHRLLDHQQLLLEHRGRNQGQGEAANGTDEAQHRSKEAGARAGDEADDQEQ